MERRECRKFTFFISLSANFLVEEADDLAGNVLSSGLLVVHDTSRGGEDDIAELTGRQQLDDPLLEVGQADVVAGRDDTSLVETAVQLDDNLAGAVVIDLLELANVACRNVLAMLRKTSGDLKREESWHRNLKKIYRRIIYRQLIGAGPWCSIDRSPSYHAEERQGKWCRGKETG